jgi:hypothetical protein
MCKTSGRLRQDNEQSTHLPREGCYSGVKRHSQSRRISKRYNRRCPNHRLNQADVGSILIDVFELLTARGCCLSQELDGFASLVSFPRHGDPMRWGEPADVPNKARYEWWCGWGLNRYIPISAMRVRFGENSEPVGGRRGFSWCPMLRVYSRRIQSAIVDQALSRVTEIKTVRYQGLAPRPDGSARKGQSG